LFVEGGPEVDFIALVVNSTAQFGVARTTHDRTEKREVNELCGQASQPPRYPLDFEKDML